MIIKILLNIISLDAEGFHSFVDAEINGKHACLLVDTGASKTVFDITRISKFVRKRKKSFKSFEQVSIGLGTNTMQSHFTEVKEFCISELKLKNYNAILLDLAHVNKSYEMLGLKPIDGVLGSDMLMEYKAVIDFKNRIIKLSI